MEMTLELMRQQMTEKLKAEGYGGLMCAGECACGLDDLMPCGSFEREDDEDYVNGCDSGWRHDDPESTTGFFVISMHKEPPSAETWNEYRATYL